MEVTESQHRWICKQIQSGRCTMGINTIDFLRRFLVCDYNDLAKVAPARCCRQARDIARFAVADVGLMVLTAIALSCWLGWWALLAVPGFYVADRWLLRWMDPTDGMLSMTLLAMFLGGVLAVCFSGLGWAFQTFVLLWSLLFFIQQVEVLLSFLLATYLLHTSRGFFNWFFVGFGTHGEAMNLSVPEDAPQWVLEFACEEQEVDEQVSLVSQGIVRLIDDGVMASAMLEAVRRQLAAAAAQAELADDLDLNDLLDRLDDAENHMCETQRTLRDADLETVPEFENVRTLMCEQLDARREVVAALRENLKKHLERSRPFSRKDVRHLNQVSPLLERRCREALNRFHRSILQ